MFFHRQLGNVFFFCYFYRVVLCIFKAHIMCIHCSKDLTFSLFKNLQCHPCFHGPHDVCQSFILKHLFRVK